MISPKKYKKFIKGYKLKQSINERNKKRIEESFLNKIISNSCFLLVKKKKITLSEKKNIKIYSIE